MSEDRYPYVSLRDDPDPADPDPADVDPADGAGDVDDEANPPPQRKRRAAAPAKRPARPARVKPAPRPPSRRGRKSAEMTVGALACMLATGLGAHWLLRDVLGYPRDLCLVAAGLAAGLATWLGPILTAARLRLAALIAPKGAR